MRGHGAAVKRSPAFFHKCSNLAREGKVKSGPAAVVFDGRATTLFNEECYRLEMTVCCSMVQGCTAVVVLVVQVSPKVKQSLNHSSSTKASSCGEWGPALVIAELDGSREVVGVQLKDSLVAMLGCDHQDVVVIGVPRDLGTIVSESNQDLGNLEMAMAGSHHQGRVARGRVGLAHFLGSLELAGNPVDQVQIALGTRRQQTLSLLFNHNCGLFVVVVCCCVARFKCACDECVVVEMGFRE